MSPRAPTQTQRRASAYCKHRHDADDHGRVVQHVIHTAGQNLQVKHPIDGFPRNHLWIVGTGGARRCERPLSRHGCNAPQEGICAPAASGEVQLGWRGMSSGHGAVSGRAAGADDSAGYQDGMRAGGESESWVASQHNISNIVDGFLQFLSTVGTKPASRAPPPPVTGATEGWDEDAEWDQSAMDELERGAVEGASPVVGPQSRVYTVTKWTMLTPDQMIDER